MTHVLSAEPQRLTPALTDVDIAAVLLALRWAVRADAILAPSAGGGVSAAVVADPPPPDVCRALQQSWRAVRAALDAAADGTECEGRPASPAILTALAWTRAERAAWWLAAKAGDDEARRRLVHFEERAAIREYDAGTPRWLAEALAVEDLLLEPAVSGASVLPSRPWESGGNDGPS